MPNHVTNRLTITGSKEALDALKKLMKGETAFDFEKVIPMPSILLQVHNGFTTINGKEVRLWTEEKIKGQTVNVAVPEKQRALWKKEYGTDNWYDWAHKNWGTKWPAYDVRMKRPSDMCLVYSFNSAWSSPEPVISKLAEQFPQLRFECRCGGEIDTPYSYSKNWRKHL